MSDERKQYVCHYSPLNLMRGEQPGKKSFRNAKAYRHHSIYSRFSALYSDKNLSRYEKIAMQIEYTHVKTITKLDHVYIETIKVEFKRKHRRVTPKIVPAIKLKSRAITFFSITG